MDIARIARQVTKLSFKDKSKQTKKSEKTSRNSGGVDIPDVYDSMLNPGVEYSFSIDMSFSVDFEGHVDGIEESELLKKLKSEIMEAIRGAALITADEFDVRTSNIRINPMIVESTVNDQTSVGEMESGIV
jgi:hypothetical protein